MVTTVPRGIIGPGDRPGRGLGGDTRQAGPGDVPSVRVVRDPGITTSPEQFGAAEGRAAQQLGGTLQRIADAADQLQKSRQGIENQMFRSRQRSLLNLELNKLTQQNPGASFESLTPQIEQVRQRVKEQLLQDFSPDGDGLAFADVDAQNLVDSTAVSVVRSHHNARVSRYASGIEETLEDIERSVVVHGDVNTGIAQYNETLNALKGTLTPAQLERARDKGQGRIARAASLWAVSNIGNLPAESAERVLEHIRNPDAKEPLLEIEQSIVDTVERSAPQDIIRIQASLGKRLTNIEDQQDEAIEVAGNNAFKEGMVRSAQDTLDLDFINENREVLSTSQFSQLVRALDEDKVDVVTNVEVFSDLMQRAATEPETVQREAMLAFTQGQINKSDFNKLFTVTRQYEGDQPAWSGNVRNFIRFSLKPNDFDVSGKQARRQQESLLDFDAWIQENDNATFEQAREQAARIVDTAKGRHGSDVSSTLELPMFVNVPPKLMTREVLNTALQKIREAMDGGEITQLEAVRQTKLIQQWMQAVTE